MKTLFFYGTLRHVPLLEVVLGRPAGDLDVAQDVLPDHVVLAAVGGPFPILRAQHGSTARGVVVTGLGAEDIVRLDYYEAGFAYDLKGCTLASGIVAQVYVPADGTWDGQGVWDHDAWRAQWGEMSVAAAREVMDGYGHVSPQEVARRFPRIRSRAWSRVLAQSPRHGQGVLRGQLDIASRRRVHSNFFALDEIALRHETFDGGRSDLLSREVFISSDAAVVLPYDPVRDRVLLVEQIRLGPIGRHDPVIWQMEPVAGLIDPGETPQDAARREAREEAGVAFDRLEASGDCYASPGATTDFYHMFVGLCDLPDGCARIGGAAHEGENIRAHLMPFQALLDMAEARRAANVPLAFLTYWLAHHRRRLQGRDAP